MRAATLTGRHTTRIRSCGVWAPGHEEIRALPRHEKQNIPNRPSGPPLDVGPRGPCWPGQPRLRFCMRSSRERTSTSGSWV